jgi:hypothetical protein
VTQGTALLANTDFPAGKIAHTWFVSSKSISHRTFLAPLRRK